MDQRERRPARPAGRVEALRRRVRSGQGHRALRAADQPGPRRPDHGPVRDAEHRRGAGGGRAPRLRAAEPHGGAHVRAHLRCQFPTWSTGGKPNLTVPRTVFKALKTLATAAEEDRVRDEHGRLDELHLVRRAELERGRRGRGGHESRASTSCSTSSTRRRSPTGARSPRRCAPQSPTSSGTAASRSIPVNLIQAMEQLNYRPPQFFTLFPAPGPLLALGDRGERRAFAHAVRAERQAAEEDGPEGAGHRRAVRRAAAANGLNYRVFDSQATASWTAWEVLAAGVRGARSLDNERICNYLRGQRGGDDVRRQAQVQPGAEQLLGRAEPREADPEPALGGGLAADLRVARLQGPPG